MEEKSKKPWKSHIQAFRGLAILIVVLSHVLTLMDFEGDARTYRTLRALFTEGSTWFMIISGYFFKYLLGRKPLLAFYATKAKNLLLPYILLSIPAIMAVLFHRHDLNLSEATTRAFYDQGPFMQVVTMYLTGIQLGPYWYIPTILLVFLCAPFFTWVDGKAFRYALMVPLFLLSFSLCRNFLYVRYGFSILTNPVSNFVYYAPVFMLGMFVCRYETAFYEGYRKNRRFWVFSVLALFIASFYDTAYASQLTFANKILSALFLVCALRDMPQKGFLVKKIDFLADISFGIYFIHGYFISTEGHFFRAHNGGQLIPDSYVFLIANTLGLCLLCALIIALSRKLAGKKSRFLLGA